jgi:hypothetical protein
MFGAIPASLIMEYGSSIGVYTQLELPLNCPPFYFIDPKFMCQVQKSLSYYSPSGSKHGMLGHVDHPTFANLRDHLDNRGYIETSRNSWNGDRVLKDFFLNNYLMIKGDRFLSGAAIGNDKNLTNNYNQGEIDPTQKNYRDPEDYD